MHVFLRDNRVRRVAASLGVAGSLVLAVGYWLMAYLAVPEPVMPGFLAAAIVLVGLSLVWWGKHPWRSFAVPIVGFVALIAIMWFGGAYLGWVA